MIITVHTKLSLLNVVVDEKHLAVRIFKFCDNCIEHMDVPVKSNKGVHC